MANHRTSERDPSSDPPLSSNPHAGKTREQLEAELNECLEKLNAATSCSEARLKETLTQLDIHQTELETQNQELRQSQQDLEESRRRYFELFDLAPIGYIAIDAEGNISRINLRASEMLGITRQQVFRRTANFLQLLPPESADTFRAHLAKTFDEGNVHSCVLHWSRRTDSPINLRVSTRRLDNPDGPSTTCFCSLEDITKLFDLERNLRKRQETIGLLTSATHDAIIMADKESLITFWNSTAADLFGTPTEAAIGTHLELLFQPEKAPAVSSFLENASPGTDSSTLAMETRCRHSRGHTFPAEVVLTRSLLNDEWVTLAMVRDITEWETTRENADRARHRLSAVMSSVTDSIYILDEQFNLVWANDAARRIFGPNLEYESCVSICREMHDGPCDACLMPKCLENGVPHEGESEMVVANGELRTFWHTVSVLDRTLEGKPKTLLKVARDVTDRKRFEQSLRDARDRADEANQAKNNFLAVINHEMRTPLNSIIAPLELITRGEAPDSSPTLIRMALDSSYNLLNLIDDILSYTSIESGRLTSAPTCLHLESYISDTSHSYRKAAEIKGLTFKAFIHPDCPPYILTDSWMLKKVLTKLLDNAVKFTETGSIHLNIAPEPDALISTSERISLRFDLRDTGPGIPDDHFPNIFKPFEQGDPSSTRRHSGIGMGLAISKRLCQALGGDLVVESVRDEGSTFTFNIVISLPSGAGPTPSDATSGPLSAFADRHPLRILIAEDNAANSLALVQSLKALGYEAPHSATDGEQLLRLLREYPSTELVLLDIHMPLLDGVKTARTIRSGSLENVDPKTYMIAVTADTFRDDQASFLDHGINDYLSKPICLDALRESLARAYAHIREAHPQIPE